MRSFTQDNVSTVLPIRIGNTVYPHGETVGFTSGSQILPSPLPITPKQRRVLTIRDGGLAILRVHGVVERCGGWSTVDCNFASLRLSYHTLAQRAPSLSSPATAVRLQWPTPSLENGLDIWAISGKVLNIEWTDGGGFSVHAFHKGPWQDFILAAQAYSSEEVRHG